MARTLIGSEIGPILKISSIWETAAWGLSEQASFLNQALIVKTSLQPAQALEAMLQIEKKAGRIRKQHWGPRCLDIDMLLVNDMCIHSPDLQVPHPYLHARRFVLVSLVEMISEWKHPELWKTMDELLQECPDSSACKMWINP
ncbi:MAG: 2-amino-4-hydroxy-6-hydroxymethyldihydropteridine diphosphokinase [Cytophagaceae bacterium]|jgi:2-amino-4-hydroxy-6-hydroxymethyldihydropteridine diphosphokinase|nr:2-amino-4-hydroxy-6-hydroxymethyldihydropteridine diphosphokinase [Cytophagaceae bacterium]